MIFLRIIGFVLQLGTEYYSEINFILFVFRDNYGEFVIVQFCAGLGLKVPCGLITSNNEKLRCEIRGDFKVGILVYQRICIGMISDKEMGSFLTKGRKFGTLS